jgi:hypothetical protein
MVAVSGRLRSDGKPAAPEHGAPVHPANNNPPNGPLEFPASQLARLYQHFRINPYWEQGVAGSNPGNTAGLAGASSGSSQQPANPK